MSERKSASFAEMLRASLRARHLSTECNRRHAQGGNFRPPVGTGSGDRGGRTSPLGGSASLTAFRVASRGTAADSPRPESRLNIIATSGDTREGRKRRGLADDVSMQG